MTGQSDHMEVAPRMWDKSLAAAYSKQPSKTGPAKPVSDSNEAEEVNQIMPAPTKVGSVDQAVAVASVSFFSKLKTYLIPAIFVICIIVVVYIVWKYITKYRNQKVEEIEAINETDLPRLEESPSQLRSAAAIISSEDTSRYEYDSDSSADEEVVPAFAKRQMTTIEELEEEKEEEDEEDEEDEEEEEEEEEEEDEDEEEDEEEEEEEEEEGEEDEDYEPEEEEEDDAGPDILEIEELIKNHGGMHDELDLTMSMDEGYGNVVEPYIPFEEPVAPAAKAPKKPRKVKRITL